MRVGVIATELEGQRTGVGRYLEGLLAGALAAEPDLRFVLFLHGAPFEHPLFRDSRVVPRFAGRSGRAWIWEQLALARVSAGERLDVLFSPSYALPLMTGLPGVVTIHDLSFERLPEEFGPAERWRRRLTARASAQRAARVLADTPAIARELVEMYALPARKVGVVPLGLDAKFALQPGERARSTNPYWLALGTVLERRHPELVIAAFAREHRRRPALRLVIAGANRLREPADLARWIAASGAAEAIEAPGYVAEDAVVELYRGAELAFYLSSYEGFGLPPLEALACGTPVVVGPGLALDELWPSYPFRVESFDADGLERVLGTLRGRGELLREVGQEGAERMKQLTWKTAGERWLAELAKAVAA